LSAFDIVWHREKQRRASLLEKQNNLYIEGIAEPPLGGAFGGGGGGGVFGG